MRRLDDPPPIAGPGREPRRGPRRDPGGRARRLDRVLLVAVVGLFLARLPLLWHGLFDRDEFEHAHAAWCWFRGMVPYRDFFEHHTPWLYVLLRPAFHWFAVDTSFDAARRFLLFGRVLSLAFAALSAWLVIQLAGFWRPPRDERRFGLVAALALVAQPFFFEKAIELRPDVPAMALFLGGLWLLLRGLARRSDAPRPAWGPFLAGGFAVGAAVMFTQKALFVLPGMFAGLAVWSWRAGRPDVRRLRGAAVFALGLALPGALTWTAFAALGAQREFIANNFLLNASWRYTPTGQFRNLLETSGPFLALFLVGAGASLSRSFRGGRRAHGELLLLFTALGLFAGLLVIPVAWKQYYLMPLPLVCLFAADGLWFLLERARPPRRPRLAAAAALLLAILPLIGLRKAFTLRSDAQLARLRQVFQTTRPTDVVMDGWEGTGVFRPHALHHYFLHDESLAMLSKAARDAYVDAVVSGEIRPRLIALDEHLKALGPRFLAFVGAHYASQDGFFYYRSAP